MTESNSINYKPVLLELFSGTGSVGRSFRARGWEVFSMDIDATTKPTLVANVLDLQWDALPDRVDCICASPPCTHYSRARTKAKTPRDLDGADDLVQAVLDIIEYYEIGLWFMENSQSGLLKSRCCLSSSTGRGLSDGPFVLVGGRFFPWTSTPLLSQLWYQMFWNYIFTDCLPASTVFGQALRALITPGLGPKRRPQGTLTVPTPLCRKFWIS